MARFVDAIDLPLPPAAAFELLADFTRLPAWDPNARAAERLDAGPLGAGSRFRVSYALLGRVVPLAYEIVRYERPRRVVLRGETPLVRLTDEILVAARDGGSRVTYEARVELSRLPALADLVLQPLFEISCRAAVRGLVAHARDLARAAQHPPRRAAAAR